MKRTWIAVAATAIGMLGLAGCGSDASSTNESATSSGVPAEVVALREQYNDQVLIYHCNSMGGGVPKAECVGTSLNRLDAIRSSAASLPDGSDKTRIVQSIDTWKATQSEWTSGKCYWLGSPVRQPADPTNCAALDQSLYDQWRGVLTALGW
ncbi:hypothetical protein ACPXB3_21405 [Gordonia sp. DT219]|uniref:hypothetical protein n=1 Tax=Gordonia sp. DT219 TaxID=3416658 RepID=UPI003CEBF5E4